MAREIVEPTLDEYGAEQHPAWGLIGASRVSSGSPGAVLFDSDIQHQHYVTVRIGRARRKRDLHRDWLSMGKEFIEIEMSEAQWASFVSSMNAGEGVPCTISRVEREQIPSFPYEPRLRETLTEVGGKAQEAIAEIQEAFDAYEQKKNAANLRTLKYAIQNMPSNMTFAAKSLSKHAENVVQRARADVEAMVVSKASQLGLDPAEIGVPQLGSGDE